MSLKPECKACQEEPFNDKLMSELLYSIFNPYHYDSGMFNLQEFIKNVLDDEEFLENFEIYSSIFNDMLKNYNYSESLWLEKVDSYKKAKEKAWRELKKRIYDGEISIDSISVSELVDFFYEEILRDLIEMGYVEGVVKDIYRKKIIFNSIAEGIIGEKVLSLAVEDMEEKGFGEHEDEISGLSPFPGYEIVEYDEMLHTFDMIDIQETLIKTAKKNFEIDVNDIISRKPKVSGKRNYVMLVDVSDSMRGKKIIGAIESAIALKKAIRKSSLDDLVTIAFNHKTRKIKEGELPNLDTKGKTDIGLALRMARKELRGKDGRGVIFLITDGEPTSSFNQYLNPWRYALVEARKLREVDAYLNILMLGKNARFIELCNKMVKEAGKGSIFYFSDPLKLKSFVYRKFKSKS